MTDRPQPSIDASTAVSTAAMEHGRNFLASLFMAIRTAQIHDPSNQAFEQAMQAVAKAAQTLFQVTGGFSLRFVDRVVFLNGNRLRFDSGAYSYMEALHTLLSEKDLGGFELHKAPSPSAIRNLVMRFAPEAEQAPRPSLEALIDEVRVLGPQRFSQAGNSDVGIDRRTIVLQSYGKLILALRERLDRVDARRARADAGQADRSSRESQALGTTDDSMRGSVDLGPPRLKPVRVIQDLVELCSDRIDFVLQLCGNRRGAPINELFGANSSLLSVVMGHAVGIPRQDLVDIGMAALFMPLGLDASMTGATRYTPINAHAAVARLMIDSGVSSTTYIRTLLIGEHCGLQPLPIGTAPHPFASMVRTVAAYQQLILGLTPAGPIHPLAALARLHNAENLAFDRRWTDLLINVLRAYPKGTEVLLDDGTPPRS